MYTAAWGDLWWHYRPANGSTYDEVNVQQQTLYEKRKERAAEKWACLQDEALGTAFSSMGKPNFICVGCKESPAIVVCHQCGPHTHYCLDCAVDLHQYSLLHHHMEIWQVYIIQAFACIIHPCMYICMNVCTCMYVCMYVCVYICLYVCVCMYVCMYVCMHVRTYVCMYVCMHVFMYVQCRP